MNHYLIRDLNKNEKPREKAIKFGIETLSDVELLATILGSGGKNTSVLELSSKLLKDFGGLNGLEKQDLRRLIDIKFINEAKACTIKAAFEIGKRLNNQDKKTIYIKKPEDIYNLLKNDLFNKEKEYLYIVTLTIRNTVIAKDCISIGSLNETILSIREVFKLIFSRNAAGFILVHNHPSQDATPSEDDISATKKVMEIAKMMEISLLDHIVITNKEYFSLKANNLLLANKKFISVEGGDKNAKYA